MLRTHPSRMAVGYAQIFCVDSAVFLFFGKKRLGLEEFRE